MPFFRNAMSRDWYLLILRNLHFQNNKQVQQSKTQLYKIRPVLNLKKKKIGKLFYPFQNLVIDESMIIFKGRVIFKEYKNKMASIWDQIVCFMWLWNLLSWILSHMLEKKIKIQNEKKNLVYQARQY